MDLDVDPDTTQPTVADLWFDPVCPWAWITSRWLVEVQRVRPVTARWHVMSLPILNAGREHTPRYQKLMNSSQQALRLLTAAAQHAETAGQDPSATLGQLYTELGTRFHRDNKPLDTATYTQALQAAGLPLDLLGARDSSDYDDAARRSHEAGIGLVGDKVGTPIISVAGAAFFGPVLTPIPGGEAAGRLWDAICLLSATDGFFELKRTRTRKPAFD
ncbi:DsbA family protein [Sphaerisporangium album]|uniref:DsbA family protein n=1 Tax=Sphaerisporangium album TaxID=509200 RepID=UPI001FE917D5|nr:DsbA family protein [Sphaerisporangium album]